MSQNFLSVGNIHFFISNCLTFQNTCHSQEILNETHGGNAVKVKGRCILCQFTKHLVFSILISY